MEAPGSGWPTGNGNRRRTHHVRFRRPRYPSRAKFRNRLRTTERPTPARVAREISPGSFCPGPIPRNPVTKVPSALC